MIENQPNEITLIYNSEKSDDKKARGYAEALPDFVVKTLDLAIEPITETQLAEIANKMNASIEDLIDPTFDSHISIHKEGLKLVAPSDMLVLMANDHKLIDTPILIIGSKAYKFNSSYELIKEDLAQGIRNHHANTEEKRA
jgi:arsenate reductase-like glutaredoxin family protein